MSDVTLKNINEPEPAILRAQYARQAEAGVEFNPKGCPHPASAIQFFEDVTSTKERHGRPTNLCICTICKTPGRIVMFDGTEAKDG